MVAMIASATETIPETTETGSIPVRVKQRLEKNSQLSYLTFSN